MHGIEQKFHYPVHKLSPRLVRRLYLKRFAELVDGLKPPQRGTGLDTFPGDACTICTVKFDNTDAKIWTRETGKCHYKCYIGWKKSRANADP